MITNGVWIKCLLIILLTQFSCKDIPFDYSCNVDDVMTLDSILISSTSYIEYLDIDRENNHLLFIETPTNQLLITDFGGNIVEKHNPWGSEDGAVGRTPTAIGYTKSHDILISSERGYFILDRNGEISTLAVRRNDFPVTLWKRIIKYGSSGERYLCVDRLFFDPRDGLPDNGDIKYYEQFRLFTSINRKKGIGEELILGFEESSIFRNQENVDFYYPDLQPYYCQYKNGIAVLFNPAEQVVLYSADWGKKILKLKPEKWFRMSSEDLRSIDIETIWAENTSYTSIAQSANDGLIICYRDIKRTTDSSAISTNYIDNSAKNCFIVYPEESNESMTIQGNEFIIPSKVNEILVHLKDDLYLCSANPSLVENDRNAIFYLAKLSCK